MCRPVSQGTQGQSEATAALARNADLTGVRQGDNGHGAKNALRDVAKVDPLLCALLDALAAQDHDHDEEVGDHDNGLVEKGKGGG